MADNESHNDAVEQITHIRQAFERAENAGDPSVIDEHRSDDVVALPLGQPPPVGKEAGTQALGDLFAVFDVEVEYTSEEVVVGEELAFDRPTVTETHIPKEGASPSSTPETPCGCIVCRPMASGNKFARSGTGGNDPLHRSNPRQIIHSLARTRANNIEK